MLCPCQMQQPEPKSYKDCCEPLHLGRDSGIAAAEPEQLMRSRFSAFVLGLTDYLSKSWHASTRPADLSLSPDDQWVKLDIVKNTDKQVHFQAYFKDAESESGYSVLDETSDFIFEDGHWFYVAGETNMYPVKLQRNDVCLCGSGKKFKKCCGK